ncbi:hypothetical protein HAZT_HAZT007394 [Hyalella azteca]|uniref:Uncharacterized protein n=1 Tax=Hyalella azteca TaxID=294128 RepID=A0A6A0H3D3_HYAAZ|nr:hypothetical protein HAZT_HAZT007394 [Hyalella azteca]
MSDLASPLLFTQRDEAHAYADDLLFCYRWLLLELKREFAFDDAQLMLEVLWSSLPPRPPSHTLPLAEVPFDPEALVRAAKNAAALATSSPLPALASARLLSQLRNGKRVSNYSAVCALRRQRSSEAALLTRRSSSRSVQLTRAASQPLKPFMNGAADASDGVSTEAGVKLTTAGVSDDVFTSVKSSAAGDVKSGSAGDALGYIEANVTPTRKIKNLKEFMELGRSSKKSSRSEQDSPSRSSGISENASPLKTNHDAQLSYPSPSKPTSNELIPHHLEYTVGTTNDPIVSKLTSCDNSIASPNVDSSSSPAHSNSTKMKIQNDGASKPNVKSNKTFSTFQTPEVPDATSKIEGIRAPASCLSTGSNGSDCAHRVPSDGSSLQDAVGDYCSLGGSSSSSVLCAVECSRRCFSESDAAFANFLDSDAVAAEEELCVEVWENPVASSPVNAPTVSLRPARSVIPNSHTDGDVAKLLKEDTGAGARLVPAKPSPSHTSPVSGKSSVMNDLSGGWAVGVGGVGLNGGSLPPPHEFGGGNPFLMIVCVSILLQHRDTIISQQLDHNDLAMHFDKLMRKHDVHHVLRDARLRYKHYCSLSFQKTDAVNKHEQC